jgi:signal transduction histidine kinase
MVLARVFRMGMEIKVEVRDTGIGLTTDERGRVFEKFFRADNSYTRSVGGTGLGLAIVKAIVDRHGAKIEVASEPGRGSTFTVSFPLNPAVPEPPNGTTPPRGIAPQTIEPESAPALPAAASAR